MSRHYLDFRCCIMDGTEYNLLYITFIDTVVPKSCRERPSEYAESSGSFEWKTQNNGMVFFFYSLFHCVLNSIQF